MEPNSSRNHVGADQAPHSRQQLPGLQAVGDLLDIRHLYHLLLQRWWLVACAVGLGLSLSLVYLIFTQKIYESRAVLQVEQADKKVVQMDDVREVNPSTLDFMNTVVQALTSRNILLAVVEQNKLRSNEYFAPPRRDGRSYTDIEVADLLADKTTVKLRRLTRLVEITVEDRDPVLARDLAQSFVREFMRENFRQRMSASSLAGEFLRDEADKLKKKLEESELKLQRYKEENQAVSLEDKQNIIVEKLREINTKVTEAKGERLRLESDIEQVRDIDPADTESLLRIRGVSEIPEVAETRTQLLEAETELASLQERYGPKHTKHIAAVQKIESLRGALAGNAGKAGEILQRQYQAAMQTEAKLSAALKEQELAALELNKVAIPFNVLQREVESDRGMYEAVVRRMKETAVTGAVEQTPYTVIEEPMVASKAARPRVMRTLALAILLSGLAGVGAIVAFDRFDSSLRSVDQAEILLRLPSLSVVPDFRAQHDRGGIPGFFGRLSRLLSPAGKPAVRPPDAPLASSRSSSVEYPIGTIEDPGSTFAESFRTLRAALSMLGPEEHRRLLLVVSAVPQEGKTGTSLNAAVALAQQGFKTLLADFDLRRPSQHKAVLDSDELPAGITDHLSSGIPLRDLVKPTSVGNLHFLSAGSRSPNPSEMLASADLPRLFADLLGDYDRIVIDSAPVNAVSDTLLIAPHVHKAILVVRSGHAPRNAVMRAVQLLQNAGAKLAGFVLNRVPVGPAAGHYYYYYGGSYGKNSAYGAESSVSRV